MSKQLIPVVEYAKRTSFLGADVSALSWKMLASLNNLPGRVALGLKVWEKGISSFMTSQALATVKNKWAKPTRSHSAYSIISFYTSLYKKGVVSWRWLLERLASPEDFSIHYGSGKLPKVSLKEAEKVIKAIQDKEDPNFAVSADPDREAAVEISYIKQTEFLLRGRISRIATLLVSDEFTGAMVGCFNKQLFDFYASEGVHASSPEEDKWRVVSNEGHILTENFSTKEEALLAYGHLDESHCRNIMQAKVGFVVKDFLQDLILDPYYSKLQVLLAKDVNQLHLHELFELMDDLESLRRDCEIGVREETVRSIPVTSEMYVLRKIEAISNVPKK